MTARGRKHPRGSTWLLYISRTQGGSSWKGEVLPTGDDVRRIIAELPTTDDWKEVLLARLVVVKASSLASLQARHMPHLGQDEFRRELRRLEALILDRWGTGLR